MSTDQISVELSNTFPTNQDPVVNVDYQATDADPKYPEDTLLELRYDLDGPLEIRWRGGERVEVRQEDAVPQGFPSKWGADHNTALRVFEALVMNAKKSNRTLPLLRGEIEPILTKKVLKDLERYGFLKSTLVPMMHKTQSFGGRQVYWLTTSGRALCQALQEEVDRVKVANGMPPG
jgi:hypothetical protein